MNNPESVVEKLIAAAGATPDPDPEIAALESSLYSDRYDPMEFNGSAFAAMDSYKAEMLASAGDLRRRVASTRTLGDVLTGDVIAHGRSIIQSLDFRNDNPTYPPVFLTFLQFPEWIGPTDNSLSRVKRALSSKPKIYRHFAGYVRDQPMGGLFELDVYALLDDAFPGALPQPRLPNSTKRADIQIQVGSADIFVESTAIGEGRHFTKQREQMQAAGLRVWAAPGPGPEHAARRIVGKIAEELQQTSAGVPNILALSFFDQMPIPPARKWALDDVWTGGATYGTRRDGTRIDLSNISRIDSIFEFSRDRLVNTHLNPNPDPACALTNAVRSEIRNALGARQLMIR
jgi:hypothetical protein